MFRQFQRLELCQDVCPPCVLPCTTLVVFIKGLAAAVTGVQTSLSGARDGLLVSERGVSCAEPPTRRSVDGSFQESISSRFRSIDALMKASSGGRAFEFTESRVERKKPERSVWMLRC